MNRWLARTLRTVLLRLPLGGIAACHSLKHQATCDDTSCEPVICDPLVSQMPSMLAIAADLDHLEKHIDWYGSVVAKSPDVWGEARLTSYRHETESRLRNELDGFRPSLQGSLSRTDTATLLMELSFNNMAKAESSASDAAKAAADSAKAAKDDAEKAKTSETAAEAAAKASSGEVDKLIEKLKKATDELNAATKAKSAIVEGQPVPAQADSNGVVAAALNASQSLEPVRILDQKARYLNYLSQLRRTNEGDDTSDAPGYSLNLVRLPVSLLPGKRTDVGHGAEVTFTINPVLDDELLPQTTRDLLVNDITSLMAFPIAKLLEGEELPLILNDSNSDNEFRRVLMMSDKRLRDQEFFAFQKQP